MTPPHINDTEDRLIEKVVLRNEAAFRALYAEHTPALYRLAVRMTGGSDAHAQDVLQEAWRRGIQGLAGFEGRSSLRTWLSAIVVRCALEMRQADIRMTQMSPDKVAVQDGQPPVVNRVDLERAFERLPAGFQTVLVLHDLEGYRHSDIAELLGVTSGTSKSQLARARARMREILGDDYAEQ